ncbi:MAG: hypothetical protein ACHP65_09850 [Legionellales bacterium]
MEKLNVLNYEFEYDAAYLKEKAALVVGKLAMCAAAPKATGYLFGGIRQAPNPMTEISGHIQAGGVDIGPKIIIFLECSAFALATDASELLNWAYTQTFGHSIQSTTSHLAKPMAAMNHPELSINAQSALAHDGQHNNTLDHQQ